MNATWNSVKQQGKKSNEGGETISKARDTAGKASTEGDNDGKPDGDGRVPDFGGH